MVTGVGNGGSSEMGVDGDIRGTTNRLFPAAAAAAVAAVAAAVVPRQERIVHSFML